MYSRHRFPAEIIGYCVWLYYTFSLSYRDIEKMMLYRGIEVTYESIREWCQKFGQQYANQLKNKRPYVTNKWHLDEVVVTIKKQQYYLWRAVDSEGMCWMFYCNGIGTQRQPSDSFANSSQNKASCHG
jgi:putative transposase